MRPARRAKVIAAAYGAAAAAGLCMVAFLAFAAYTALLNDFDPPYAALLTAAALLVAAVSIVLAARLVASGRKRSAARARDDDLTRALEEVLESQANPALNAWIRRHPDGAAAATLVLGIAAGYSGSVHRILRSLYREYAEAEQERRAPSPD